MFNKLFCLCEDIVRAVVAPVESIIDVSRVVTKPVADLAEEARDEIKEITKDITETY